MDHFFKKIRVGIFNQHFDQLGGGTTHSFKIIEFLKKYYDCEVILPKKAMDSGWMKKMLNLDTDNVKYLEYSKGIGNKYKEMFFNISHWKAEQTDALKKFMIVFFPQFYFPIFDYHLIANSEYTKENIEKRWSVDPKEISVIYPPIQSSVFESKEKKNMIIHVSRFASPRPESDKAHLQMIQAFKQMKLKDWELHMVGQPQDVDYYKNLQNQAAGYKIYFHEKVPFQRLKELYSESKIYWHMTGISMPNEVGAQEHFGMSIVEAMASGCVPVVYNSGGPKEIISNDLDGFLVKDIQELKDRTIDLIKNEKKLKEMSVLAQDRANCFDQSKIEKQFFNLVARTNLVRIITVCHNNSKLTEEFVHRLFEVTPPGFELVLLNNGSTDNTQLVLKKLQDKYGEENLKIVESKKNDSYSKANNMALFVSEYEKEKRKYVCYLNNDTLPQWGWLERMVDVLESDPEVGIVGSRLYFPEKNGNWIIQHAGVEFDAGMSPKHIGRNKKHDEVQNKGIQEVEAVTGACMLVRREFAKFKEDFERGYYEDTDMCLSVRESGKKVVINHDSQLIHYEGKTQDLYKKSDPAKFQKITEENKAKFYKIWGNKIKTLDKVSKSFKPAVSDGVPLNIEIGGGETPLYDKYEQVDLRALKGVKHNNDARSLPFQTGTVNNICACYVLQCLSKKGAADAIKEWHRVLAPGGKLEIHVPDLEKMIRVSSADIEKALIEIYGEQKHELDYHKSGWTKKTLESLLSSVNFVRISPLGSPKNRPESLSLVAYKSKEA